MLKLVMLAVIAGCYVGFGFSITLLIGGNIGMDILQQRPGLFNLVLGYPTAFTFIFICGGELFSSNCAYMATAWWEGRATALDCIRLWVTSWVGNFVGTATFVALMVVSGAFDGRDAYTIFLGTRKAHHSFGGCFVLGVLCNWLVCIASWQANAARDMTGKFFAICLPVSAFVMLGCEHVVADMYLLPLAIALGHPSLTAYDLAVGTLLPTTLGNWFGGAVCVATVYALAYGTPNKTVTEWAARKGTSASPARGPTNGDDFAPQLGA
ncbi:putative transporter yrhG [Monoraphidium neglectum]|uniref:Putative transporter yrhG n=1 Tax=Monoraphidium neglectum TaxID=145388 RepID=A0A0D2MZA2_9CHLO|nr:putative transporter yrhG [Monoraphidium neglectum]KIZ05617.1 putative transporter yrhG [Monoraphidium neglectum]|eukprot:XP_013904636.1 putative transporter yrhG [Monoraphidium neglectum]